MQRLIPLLSRARLVSRHLALVLGATLGVVPLVSLHADLTYPPVDTCPYIGSFIYDDGASGDSWWLTSSSTNQTSGNVTYTFSDGQSGHSSTMVWTPTGTLVSWTINLGGAGVLNYTDGAGSGHLGDFVRQGSSTALSNVNNINGWDYQATSDGRLTPSFVTTEQNFLQTFTYNGTTYQPLSVAYDHQTRLITKYSGGAVTITSTHDLTEYPEQVAIGLPNGTVANYVGENGITYLYRSSSTAPNKWTKINNYPLSVGADAVTLSRPPMRSFAWNGNTYTLSFPDWQQPTASNFGAPLRLVWFYDSATTYLDSPSYYSPNGYVNGDICSAVLNPDGSMASLWVEDDPGGSENDAMIVGGPYQYNIVSYTTSLQSSACNFTAINGHPCVTNNTVVTLSTPVSGFVYAGVTYQSQSTTLNANGTATTTYHGSNGSAVATVQWSPSSYQVDGLQIKPFGSGSSYVANYVDGDAVGRPGTYVWSNSSTYGNYLTQVNAAHFTDTGGAALPTGGYSNQNNIFDILSNSMSMGAWVNDPNHVGFSLSYDDGEPVTVPASIEFTASRPLTSWLWTAATSDGSSANYVMQVDETSRLMLYPPASSASGAPAVPAPAVVLDPNPGGTSRFDGSVRFDGLVRVAPQGDISMGAFTADPAPQ